MQQFTGQSTLWTVINPLNTPMQTLKRDYSCFTDVDADSVTMDLHKASPPSISKCKALFQPFFPKINRMAIFKKKKKSLSALHTLLHSPRAVVSLAKGWEKQQSMQQTLAVLYKSRCSYSIAVPAVQGLGRRCQRKELRLLQVTRPRKGRAKD